MVCSYAMAPNFVWLQTMFCTCVKETVLFSFLWSLLREMADRLASRGYSLKKQTRWSNDKTVIELGYRKNIVICQCLADQLFASAFGFGK